MNKGLMLILLTSLIAVACNRNTIGRASKELIIDEITFDYMSARTKIKYDDGTKDLSGTANIRMAYDSIIWMSITPGLGIEAARLLITQDSIMFMDRINKKYKVMGYDEIEKTYQFDLDFGMIQSLILGNLVLPYSRQGLKKQPEGYSYRQESQNIIIDSFIGLTSKKLERFDATDVRNDNSISVNYGVFKAVGDEMIPYEIEAIYTPATGSKTATTIDIGYTKAEIEEQSLKFPFAIPSKYTSY